MDTNLYRRITQHAIDIATGTENLPWTGLYTARNLYKLLEMSDEPLSREELAELMDLSDQYVNQIIMALKAGGVRIQSIPMDTKCGRPKLKYAVK